MGQLLIEPKSLARCGRWNVGTFSMCVAAFVCGMALVMGISIRAYAQSTNYDNFGSEFYVAYCPNEGGEVDAPFETLNVMDLYITSRVVAHGEVDIPALNFFQSFTTTPGQITTIILPNGNNNSPTVTLPENMDEQVVHGMAVHIASDSQVAVFGMNHKEYSSDAFMALPTRVLGTEYRTMNYNTSEPNFDNTPGEFVIVAVQDSTDVTVTLNAISSTGAPPNKAVTVRMNKGDCYMVQGATNSLGNDLTGSLVESDYPIAVLSGHKRTAIPDTAVNIDGNPSRDILVEQLPPVSAWGDSALVVPYATSTLPDLVRVVFSEDSTQLTVNGNTVPGYFDAGQFYEITHLPGVTSIQATKPIEVGQYMHTSWGGLNDPRLEAYGDPALALVFPVEQFTTSYTIISVINPDAYTGNFVNIVADQSAISTMTIDGTPISPSEFHPIPNTRFDYAQHQLVQGTHNLAGSLPFGVTVYGLGPVDSYSYVGGTLLKTITPLQTVGLTIDFGERVLTPAEISNPPSYGYPNGTFDTTVILQNISQDTVNIYSFPKRIQDTDRFNVVGTTNGPNAPRDTIPGPGLPLKIPPLATDSFTIQFWPHEVNRRMHTQITANTDHLRAYVVDVYGEGVLDEMGIFADTTKTLTIDTLNFGTLTNQDNPMDSEVYVGNAGSAPLTVNSVSLSSPSVLFSQPGINYGGPVAIPFTIAQPPSGAASVQVQFNPLGQPKGIYSDSLYIVSTSSTHLVVLIGRVDSIAALSPAVDSVTWQTTMVCDDSSFAIPISNPNDLPVTVTNATITGANASDFSMVSPMPEIIPPGGLGTVTVDFAPDGNGIKTGQAILTFNLPKTAHPDTVNLMGTGDKPVLEFSAPTNVHANIVDNYFMMPIFARTDLTPYAPDGYHIYVQYDSVNLQLVDVVSAGTFTPTGYFSILQSTPPGRDTINFQQVDENSSIEAAKISGGGPTDQTPMIYLKFQPILNGSQYPIDASDFTFNKGFPITYSIVFDDLLIPYQCEDHLFDSGYAQVGPACGPQVLEQQPFIPEAMMLGAPTPNPAGTGTNANTTNGCISVQYDVGTDATSENGTAPVAIDLIDPQGTVLRSLVNGPVQPGYYTATIDPATLPSGVYLIRMVAGGYYRVRNLVIQK